MFAFLYKAREALGNDFSKQRYSGPVHTGRGGARKCCSQKIERIVANWSVHTALPATSFEGFSRKFACKPAYASCVNGALCSPLQVGVPSVAWRRLRRQWSVLWPSCSSSASVSSPTSPSPEVLTSTDSVLTRYTAHLDNLRTVNTPVHKGWTYPEPYFTTSRSFTNHNTTTAPLTGLVVLDHFNLAFYSLCQLDSTSVHLPQAKLEAVQQHRGYKAPHSVPSNQPLVSTPPEGRHWPFSGTQWKHRVSAKLQGRAPLVRSAIRLLNIRTTIVEWERRHNRMFWWVAMPRVEFLWELEVVRGNAGTMSHPFSDSELGANIIQQSLWCYLQVCPG